MNERKTFVCKRARMALWLMDQGYRPYEVAPDRDNPANDVFLFTATEALYQAVKNYFNGNDIWERRG